MDLQSWSRQGFSSEYISRCFLILADPISWRFSHQRMLNCQGNVLQIISRASMLDYVQDIWSISLMNEIRMDLPLFIIDWQNSIFLWLWTRRNVMKKVSNETCLFTKNIKLALETQKESYGKLLSFINVDGVFSVDRLYGLLSSTGMYTIPA